jgi:hypothetical protein
VGDGAAHRAGLERLAGGVAAEVEGAGAGQALAAAEVVVEQQDLEHYEFRLVREALMEREVLWAMAPHIVWPLRFVQSEYSKARRRPGLSGSPAGSRLRSRVRVPGRRLRPPKFRLVREALMEREVLWAMAPHIVWPLRFVLPHLEGAGRA